MSSSKPKKTTSIAIDADLHKEYRAYVDRLGLSMNLVNNVIIRAVVDGEIPIQVAIEVEPTQKPIQINRGAQAA